MSDDDFIDLIVSVPFRGSRSEMKAASNDTKLKGKVSVPFRGSRSEIRAYKGLVGTDEPAFPSPFGVHVLKSDGRLTDDDLVDLFPSPFGVHVLKYYAASPCAWSFEFPSPFGVHVLK